MRAFPVQFYTRSPPATLIVPTYAFEPGTIIYAPFRVSPIFGIRCFSQVCVPIIVSHPVDVIYLLFWPFACLVKEREPVLAV